MSNECSGETVSRDIARVVVSRDDIAKRVGELGLAISDCYADEELTILAVLTGSLIFLGDLIRKLPMRMRLDLVSVCSYPGRSKESQGPHFTTPIPANLTGRHVLVIDDILDSGGTLRVLLDAVEKMGPASLRSCVLLRKDRPDLSNRITPDFVGFEVPNEFLVGYGLDFDHLYRNLPEICVLDRHVCSDAPASRSGGAD